MAVLENERLFKQGDVVRFVYFGVEEEGTVAQNQRRPDGIVWVWRKKDNAAPRYQWFHAESLTLVKEN